MTVSDLSMLNPAKRRRLVRGALIRAATSVVTPMLLYYLLPLDRTLGAAPVAMLTTGLLAFAAFATWQVRAILRSDYPVLRATETLALTISLFLLLFAITYFLMAQAHSESFSEVLSRTDALYFTVTVFTTVGFGDITPTSEATRIVTMVQMLADLLVLGLLIRTVLGAVSTGRQRKAADLADPEPGDPKPRDPEPGQRPNHPGAPGDG